LDDENVIYWNKNGDMTILNCNTLVQISLIGHKDTVQEVFVDDSTIYSYSLDNTIRSWDFCGKSICLWNSEKFTQFSHFNKNKKQSISVIYSNESMELIK
jgi:WD40 repeat protein